MRYCGIVILLILASCKPTQPTATASYSEDLSIHRPKMEVDTSANSVETITEDFEPITGHIKAELDSIIRISVAQNKESKVVEGYIIQVYTGNSRERANDIRRKVDSYFPDLEPKITYRQPNFQVKAGRFTDRLKAHKTLQALQEEFPKALLVPERFKISYE